MAEDEEEVVPEVDQQQALAQRGAAVKEMFAKAAGRIHDSAVMIRFCNEVAAAAEDASAVPLLISEGCIPVITCAMKTHMDNPELLSSACRALLLGNFSYKQNVAAQTAIEQEHTVTTTLLILRPANGNPFFYLKLQVPNKLSPDKSSI